MVGSEAQVSVHEAHHRVKNSLQLVASMLANHARRSADRCVASELPDASRRIIAVARLHEHLQQRPDQSVDVADYLAQICGDLAASIGDGAHDPHVNLHAVKAELPASDAVALGLIVNELVTNALKYAYPDGVGAINVDFEHLPSGYKLSVADHGVGRLVPTGRQFDGLGSSFVHQFATALRGSITTLDNAPGIQVSVTFGERPAPMSLQD